MFAKKDKTKRQGELLSVFLRVRAIFGNFRAMALLNGFCAQIRSGKNQIGEISYDNK